jgi:hypothetical protein
MTPDRADAALRAAFRGRPGCATVLDRNTGRALAQWRPDLVKNWAAAPGSVLKPLVLSVLKPIDASLPCPRTLSIGGIAFHCTHAPIVEPVDASTAVALSCNNWFAGRAATIDPAQLRTLFAGADFQTPATPSAVQLLVLGARGIRVTPSWLARAYFKLLTGAPPQVIAGLERAITEGTAHAALPALGGKTGTSREAAWFAGYVGTVLLVIALPAGTGGGDAAPLAGEFFTQCAR